MLVCIENGCHLHAMFVNSIDSSEDWDLEGVHLHELKVLARIVSTTLNSPFLSANRRIKTAARRLSGSE